MAAGTGPRTTRLIRLEDRQLAPVVRAIFAALEELLAFDRASLVLLDEHSTPYKAAVHAPAVADAKAAEATNAEAREVEHTTSMPAGDVSDECISANVYRVIETGLAIVNESVEPYDACSGHLVEMGVASTIVAPFAVGDTVLGTLNVGSMQSAAYGERHVEALRELTGKFARALQSAQQFVAKPQQLGGVNAGRAPLEESADRPVFLFRPERVVEQMSEALLIDDIDGKVIFVNRAFRQLFGLDEEDVANLVLEDYIDPEWRPTLRKRHDDRVRGKHVPNEFGYVGLKKDGSRLDLEVTVVPIVEDGVTLGTQSVIRDVSARKELERRATQAQKMEALGQLAGGVAHDFNNLLTAILAYPEIIRQKLEQGAGVDEELKQVELAAERATVLTKQLLTFSRKQVVKPEPVRVHQAVGAIMPLLRRLIEDNVELSQAGVAHGDDEAVMIDPGQLEQVVINLVVNARDAGAKRIDVRMKSVSLTEQQAAKLGLRARRVARVSVTDDGSGMTEEVVAKVFQPFFTTKPVGRGTGLGLATVYGIIQSAGGHVAIDTEVGRGTTIAIYLPIVRAEQRQPTAVPMSTIRRNARVLIVEDDEVTARVLVAMLKSSGLTVQRAKDGQEAMDIISDSANELDLVISDFIMPRAGGGEVVAHLARHRPEVPSILLSGYTPGKLAELLPDKHVPLVGKPIKRARLLQAVAVALDSVAKADKTGADQTQPVAR